MDEAFAALHKAKACGVVLEKRNLNRDSNDLLDDPDLSKKNEAIRLIKKIKVETMEMGIGGKYNPALMYQ